MQTNHSKSIKGLSIAVIALSTLTILACVVGFFTLGAGAYAWDRYGTDAVTYSNNDAWATAHLGEGHMGDGHYGVYYDGEDVFGLMGFILTLAGIAMAWVLISSVITLVSGILGLRRADNYHRMRSVFGWGVAGAIVAGLAGRLITCVLLVVVAVFANKDKNMTEEEYHRTEGASNTPTGAMPNAGYAPWGQPVQSQPQPPASTWGQPAQPYAGYAGSVPASGYTPPTQQPFTQAPSAYQASYGQPAAPTSAPTSFAQDQVDAAWGQPMRPAGVQPTWMQQSSPHVAAQVPTQQPEWQQAPSAYQTTYGQPVQPTAAQPAQTSSSQPIATQPTTEPTTDTQPAEQQDEAASQQAGAQDALGLQDPTGSQTGSEAAQEENPRQS